MHYLKTKQFEVMSDLSFQNAINTAAQKLTKKDFRPSLTSRILQMFLLIAVIAGVAGSQTALTVSGLEGSAKIQHADRRNWTKLSEGDKITDNDIIESSFQSKVTVSDASNNALTIGSNTKILINVTQPYKGGDATRLNITLFNGGLFVKAATKCRADIFTSNAVGHIDSGTVSVILDDRSGQTGFQCLGGQVEIRNISQLEGTMIEAGQASVISSGASPSSPQPISSKHLTVLNQFFGVSLIKQEMAASNIAAADEGSGEKISFSQGLENRQDASKTAPKEPDRYKPIFNYNQLYGKMQEIQEKDGRHYRFIKQSVKPHNHHVELGAGFLLAKDNSDAYPGVVIPLGLYFKYASIGFKMPLLSDYEGKMSPHFSGIKGIMDKIEHFHAGSLADSMYLAVEPIKSLTLGNGAVVDGYCNRNRYSVFSTAGAVAQFKLYPVNFKGFISDISSFKTGGFLFLAEPGPYKFGAGYYFDVNRTSPVSEDYSPRFFEPLPDSTLQDTGNLDKDVHIYEIEAGVELINTHWIYVAFSAAFAQKRSAGLNDGFMLKGPGTTIEWGRMHLATGFSVETGRILAGQFNSFYETNRKRITGTGTVLSQNSILSKDRRAVGLYLDLGASPADGMSINFNYKQDINNHDIFADTAENQHALDYTFGLSIAVDSMIAPKAVSFGELYARQIHGGYYPYNSGFFKSWGFETGLHFISAPLAGALSFELNSSLFYLDLDNEDEPAESFNGKIDDGEFLFELYAGLRVGFL
jgi:hypothetical protein